MVSNWLNFGQDVNLVNLVVKMFNWLIIWLRPLTGYSFGLHVRFTLVNYRDAIL